MPETTPQLTPTEPSAVVPPAEQPKKGTGLLWLAIALGVAILGGSAYFLYAQQTKLSEEVLQTPPGLVTHTPPATPTITSSDSVADIEKDLSGTTIEAGNSSEFDADLQSIE